MSRVIEEPINVEPNFHHHPALFTWRNQSHQVKVVIEEWRDTGCWWDNEGEKVFFRLEVDGGGIYELYHDLLQQKWFIYRVLD